MRHTIALISTCLVLAVAGCKKTPSSSDEQPLSARGTLLTKQEWILTGRRFRQGTNPWQDDFASMKSCTKDDRYRYGADGTYRELAGQEHCAGGDFLLDGTWKLTGNDTKLHFSITVPNQAPEEYDEDIVRLDETTLVLNNHSASQVIEFTYGHP